jgi:hypothetical protein
MSKDDLEKWAARLAEINQHIQDIRAVRPILQKKADYEMETLSRIERAIMKAK